MSLYVPSQSLSAAPASLHGDLRSSRDRLENILSSLRNVGDSLYGSMPQPIAGKTDTPEPTGSIRRTVDRVNTLISLIEDEISRLNNNL